MMSPALYDRVEIGTPGQPFEGRPVVTLLLSNGTSLRTDRLDADGLRACAQRSTRNPRLWIDQRGWPRGVEEIAIDGYRFLVLRDKVIAVFMATQWDFGDTTPPPTIADGAAREFHRLPLDEKTLNALFGEADVRFEDFADPL
jgi:hypothetical protein